jgi:hypothetical protein
VSQLLAWQLAGMAAFWVAFSLLKTNHARADRRPALGWWASFGTWLLVGAPPFVALGVLLVLQPAWMSNPLVTVMLGAILWSLSWALASRFPFVGDAVTTLRERESRRLEKGLI